MQLKYTPTTLKKLEQLLNALAYEVRYEKGHFQSGYCVVEHRKIVIINKFFDTEARINSLLDIIGRLPADGTAVPKELQTFYEHILATPTASPLT